MNVRRSSKIEHYYHVIWATQEREPSLNDVIVQDVYRLITHSVTSLNGTVVAIGGMADHVHVLMRLPGRTCVPDVVQNAKGTSSRAINERRLIPSHFGWQSGYGSFTVSPSHVPDVVDYIHRQKEHHDSGRIQPDFEATYVEVVDLDYRDEV